MTDREQTRTVNRSLADCHVDVLASAYPHLAAIRDAAASLAVDNSDPHQQLNRIARATKGLEDVFHDARHLITAELYGVEIADRCEDDYPGTHRLRIADEISEFLRGDQ
jgi:hypothetical protein